MQPTATYFNLPQPTAISRVVAKDSIPKIETLDNLLAPLDLNLNSLLKLIVETRC